MVSMLISKKVKTCHLDLMCLSKQVGLLRIPSFDSICNVQFARQNNYNLCLPLYFLLKGNLHVTPDGLT